MMRRFVLLIVRLISLLAGAGGVATGVFGGSQIQHARSALEEHGRRYEQRYASHLHSIEETNQVLSEFGTVQENAQREVMYRMREFLRRHEKQVREIKYPIIDTVEILDHQVQYETKLDLEIESWLRGAASTVIAGYSAPLALQSMVAKTGKASTGRRISSLRGAAAESATKAFFGGGSLASGGGGIRGGKRLLTKTSTGIGLLFAGLVVKNRGTKAKTEAEAQHTLIEDGIARLDLQDELCRGVRLRTTELRDTLTRLAANATESLNVLESVPFDMQEHGAQLQESLILVKGVGALLAVPIFDEDGNLHEDSEKLIFKYRDY